MITKGNEVHFLYFCVVFYSFRRNFFFLFSEICPDLGSLCSTPSPVFKG